MVSRLEDIRQLRTTNDSTNRITTAKSFCQCKCIRLNIVSLETKPFSSPAHSTLHLITKHQQVLLITESPHILHELFVRRNDAAFALKGFQHNGNRLLVNKRLHGLNVIIVRMHKAFWHRLKPFLDLGLSSSRSSSKRPAVEGTLHANHFVLTRIMAPQPSEFDHALISLSTRVTKEALAFER